MIQKCVVNQGFYGGCAEARNGIARELDNKECGGDDQIQ